MSMCVCIIYGIYTKIISVLINSIPRYSFVNLYMLEKVCLLAESFTADVTFKRFLACVGP